MNNIKINNNPNDVIMSQKMKQKQAEIEKLAPNFKKILESKDKEKLREVAEDFEELFVNMILKSMRATLSKTSFGESSYEKDIYEGMLDEKYAEEIAKTGNLGISDMIMKSFEPYLNQYKKEPIKDSFDFKG